MAARPASLPNLKVHNDGLTEFGSISPRGRGSSGLLSRLWGSGPKTRMAAAAAAAQQEQEQSFDDSSSVTSASEGQSTFYGSSLAYVRPVDYPAPVNFSLGESGSSSGSGQRQQHRSLRSVVQALSHLMDKKPVQGLKPYKEGDFRQYWMPDSSCKECYDCGEKFTTFRRRHHCRICGQIFCSSCCNQEVPGRVIGILGSLRACTYCCKVISEYVLDVSGDFGELKEKLRKIADSEITVSPAGSRKPSVILSSADPGSVPARNIFDFLPTTEAYKSLEDISTEERNLLTKESHQLRSLFAALTSEDGGIPLQNHRHRLRTYTGCFTGHELVQWLIATDRVANHEQAAAVGQALVDARLIKSPTVANCAFHDGLVLYRPCSGSDVSSTMTGSFSLDMESAAAAVVEQEPKWLQDLEQQDEAGKCVGIGQPATIVAVGSLDKFGNTTSSVGTDDLSRESQPNLSGQSWPDSSTSNSGASSAPTEAWTADSGHVGAAEQLCELGEVCLPAFDPENANSEILMRDRLRDMHDTHLMALTGQLLSRAGLSLSWTEPLIELAKSVTHFVKPDVKFSSDRMDVRSYVHIKKLRTGQRLDIDVVYGTVFTKQVVHKRMRTSITNATIMLLQSSIEYQRVANKFSSLDPQILQEQEYLGNCVAKICKYKPDVLLVEKTVSRIAQELLLEAGITLVLNVKESVMQRVARSTMADLVTSIDSLVNAPVLGKCHLFELRTFRFDDGYFKTLMYFDGCPANLGCTVLIRSSSYGELCKVKPVLSFLLYAYQGSALEMAFMMDQCASVAAPEKDDSFVQSILKPPASGKQSHSRTPSGQVKTDDVSQLKTKANLAQDDSTVSGTCGTATASLDGVQPATALLASSSTSVVQPLEEPGHALGSVPAIVQQAEACAASWTWSVSQPSKDSVADPLSLVESTDSADNELGASKQVPAQGAAKLPVVQLRDELRPQSVRRLQAVLADTILSVSPMVKAELPFFETSAGRCSPLRGFFPTILYWSPALEATEGRSFSSLHSLDNRGELALVAVPKSESFDYRLEAPQLELASVEVSAPHPLINAVMQKPDDDGHVLALLASYRAAGSRLRARSGDRCSDSTSLHHHDTDISIAVDVANDGEHEMAPRIDCLDIRHHQRISVLFSSFSHESANAPELCVNPWVVNMHFSGRNDMTLGTFLERYCFRESYYCPSVTCETPMVKHVRRFVHDAGCLHLVMKQLDLEQPVVDATHILMWSYCRKCKKATSVVPMSHSTWSMSFAKYLELRLQAQPTGSRVLPECRHSLHREYYQYFRSGRLVASFKYASITSRELRLPPLEVTFDLNKPLAILKENVNNLHHKAFSMYTSITEGLCKIRDSAGEAKKLIISEISEDHERERTRFRDQINSVLMQMPSVDGPKLDAKTLLLMSAEMVRLKRHVANAIHEWNQKLQWLVNMKEEKVNLREDKGNARDASDRLSSTSKSKKASTSDFTKYLPEDYLTAAVDDVSYHGTQHVSIAVDAARSDDVDVGTPQEVFDSPVSAALPSAALPWQGNAAATSAGEQTEVDAAVEVNCSTPLSTSATADTEAALPSMSSPPAAVAGPVTPTQKDSAATPPLFEDSLNESSPAREESSSNLVKMRPRSSKAPDDDFKVKPKSGVLGFERIFTNIFLSDISQIEVALQIPLDQHFIVHWSPDSPTAPPPLIIYEEEPSSIIAFTMSSNDYKKKVVDLKLELKAQHPNISFTGTLSPVDPDRPLPESGTKAISPAAASAPGTRLAPAVDPASKLQDGDFSDFMKDDVDNERFGNRDAERAKMEFLNCHIEMQFTEKTSSGDKVAQFYCKVYFAEHFRKLRKLLMPNQEDLFVHSLTRCVKWQAKGGKSGLRFCKTLDDRFILKQLSRYEIQSFLEFAPHYIAYLTDAHNEKKPTALAKIFGIYRIGFRNHTTGAAMKQDLLIMENLFYRRILTKVFDLKGSVRNRLVSTSRRKEDDVVLLDENLLRHIVESPLYVRPHSKTVLQQAVVNDSHFLSSHLIMDYSLLVGIDDQSKEFVVGIIDYIRTFTWDKKLEMVVKSSAFLGGQGKMPTIVSPEVYRTRFVEAMERYFYLVPDRWSGLADADC